MRLSRSLLAGALAVLFVRSSPLDAQVKIDQRRAVTPTASLRIMGAFGELHVIGWDKDSVVVSGAIPKGGRLEGNFGRTTQDGPATGMKMFLELVDETQSPQAKIEMRIPARARLWIKGGSSVVTATGVTGSLDINVIGGSVQVSGAPRELTIEAMDASVRVDGSPEWVRAKTATGDVVFTGGSGDASLSTVSGALRIAGGTFERARLESVTGPVTFSGDLAAQGSLDVNTHSGAIQIAVPHTASAELDVASMIGTIENALTGRPAVPGREGRGQEIGLRLGGGSARIYVRTFKGNVDLRPR